MKALSSITTVHSTPGSEGFTMAAFEQQNVLVPVVTLWGMGWASCRDEELERRTNLEFDPNWCFRPSAKF